MTELVRETQAGRIAGYAQDGVARWLGIPYAQAGRFAAAEPPAVWEGIRPAVNQGPQCPQMFGQSVRQARLARPDFDEDCLQLNIYAPSRETERPRAVFFWIHGGAFLVGGGGPYDGAALAREGDVIVVTINYRVGVLGFVNFGEVLGLPQIPSNLGLRDQIFALRWVRENIATFGGDPARVTIAGQSAGSMSVSLLMLCAQASPLFHGAIMQSGAISLIHERGKSREVARHYARLLDLDQGGLDKLRTMDLHRLFEAQAAIGKLERNGIPAAPWYDGDLLPASLAEARVHPTAEVPLIAGATREEIRLFDLLPGDTLPRKWPELEALIRRQLPPSRAEGVLAAYPRTRRGRIALASDLSFAMPTRFFAEQHARRHPTWFYRFDYAHPLVGATHGLDLTLIWPMRGIRAALARGGRQTGRRAALGERIRAEFAHFTHHGTPREGWPRFSGERPAIKVFGLEDRVAEAPDADRVAAWAGSLVGPGLDAKA